MESARDKQTGKIIDAEQLWELDYVDPHGYLCRGCEALVSPCSYLPENKVRPYFSAKAGHKPGCDVDGESKLVARAQKQRITTLEGFPGSFPYRLELRETRDVVQTAGTDVNHSSKTQKNKRNGTDGGKRNRSWVAQTIRPLCRTFLNYPYDRDLPLNIPNVTGRTYQSIFWRLSGQIIQQYTDLRIFYAPIQWSKPVQTEEWLEIRLSYGEWKDKKLIQPYIVRIDWKNWSQAKRHSVLREIETARNECIKEQKNNRRKKGWLFFIGCQDHDNPAIFHLSDHRLVCCIVGEMIYPKNKKDK